MFILLLLVYAAVTISLIAGAVVVLPNATFRGRSAHAVATWASVGGIAAAIGVPLSVFTPVFWWGIVGCLIVEIICACLVWYWYRAGRATDVDPVEWAQQQLDTAPQGRPPSFMPWAWLGALVAPVWVCFGRLLLSGDGGWGTFFAVFFIVPFVLVLMIPVLILHRNAARWGGRQFPLLLRISFFAQWGACLLLGFFVSDFGDSTTIPSLAERWIGAVDGSLFARVVAPVTLIAVLVAAWLTAIVASVVLSRRSRV